MKLTIIVCMLACVLFALSGETLNAAAIPRPEHPRPDFQRDAWQNLNGEWDFAFDPDNKGVGEGWFERDSLPEKIIVPYHVESELSGIARKDPPNVCWYLKIFDVADNRKKGRLILNFGAVDYHARVWLNGKELGEHYGGYSPFSFDITGQAGEKNNVLVVRAWDSLDRMQVRGKQSPSGEPHGIVYTPVTGIWQTVWIERTGYPYVSSYRFVPADDLSGGVFTLAVVGKEDGIKADIIITGDSGVKETVHWQGGQALWKAGSPRPWSPENPALYDVEILLFDSEGDVLDKVKTYVGIRTIEARDGKVYLNGKEFYQKLLLDQGYFPGGFYTPADDAVMRADVEMYKRMGFNGLRKHMKIEDPRFLYWCDQVGLVVWEEMPGLGFGRPRRVPGWAMDRFRDEWMDVIERDFNHPSIIAWTPYNENWGIMQMHWHQGTRDWAFEMIRLTRERDPSRLVVDNSGGWHYDTDVWDFHQYHPTVRTTRSLYEAFDLKPGDQTDYAWWLTRMIKGEPILPMFYKDVKYEGQPIIVSEYGGFGFYPTASKKGLLELYTEYTLAIKDYPHIVGYCYTQPYDIEQEQNGLMTFDRKPKVEPEEIKKINDLMGQ